MVTLFDQERVTELHEYNLVKDARQEGWEKGQQDGWEKGQQDGWEKGQQDGWEKGQQKGKQEGIEKGIRATVLTLKEFTADKVAIAQKLVKQFELLPHVAEEKVAQYWES